MKNLPLERQHFPSENDRREDYKNCHVAATTMAKKIYE